MRSNAFFALAAVLLVAGVLFGMNPRHFVAAGFCLAGGAFAFIRAIVVLGAGDKKIDPHTQRGF